MAKAILISIKPKWVMKILNGEKTIEIRKKFPKDYVGWVYIYCTKGKEQLFQDINKKWFVTNCFGKDGFNGKVVARFWCDKVEEMYYCDEQYLKPSCLSIHEMFDYLKEKNGYAIHIAKLEIFDKPKEISEFRKPMEYTKYCNRNCSNCDYAGFNNKTQKWEFECSITRAPQSWCFIEI